MVKYGILAAVAGLALFFAVGIYDADPTKSDYARLEGTWVLVGVETRGKPHSAKDLDISPETWIIRRRRLTVLEEDADGRPVEKRYRIQLDPSQTPPAMDLLFPDGRNHAIYALDRDELTVCASEGLGENEPHERPAHFTTIQEQNKGLYGLILYRFKRDKDGRGSVVGRPERIRESKPTGKDP